MNKNSRKELNLVKDTIIVVLKDNIILINTSEIIYKYKINRERGSF